MSTLKKGRTLIVGSQVYRTRQDRRLLYEDVLGIDMLPGPGVDRVLNLEEKLPTDIGIFSHIECCSVLEHSQRPWLMAINIENLLVPNGTLDLEVPFVWRVHAYPSDYWRFTVEGVRLLFPNIGWNQLGYYHNDQFRTKITNRVTIEKVPHFARTTVKGSGFRLTNR